MRDMPVYMSFQNSNMGVMLLGARRWSRKFFLSCWLVGLLDVLFIFNFIFEILFLGRVRSLVFRFCERRILDLVRSR